jgi:hypothetical protein
VVALVGVRVSEPARLRGLRAPLLMYVQHTASWRTSHEAAEEPAAVPVAQVVKGNAAPPHPHASGAL